MSPAIRLYICSLWCTILFLSGTIMHYHVHTIGVKGFKFGRIVLAAEMHIFIWYNFHILSSKYLTIKLQKYCLKQKANLFAFLDTTSSDSDKSSSSYQYPVRSPYIIDLHKICLHCWKVVSNSKVQFHHFNFSWFCHSSISIILNQNFHGIWVECKQNVKNISEITRWNTLMFVKRDIFWTVCLQSSCKNVCLKIFVWGLAFKFGICLRT